MTRWSRSSVSALAGFVGSVVAANWVAGTFGQVHLFGLGWLVPWGTLAAGLALVLREVVQRSGGLGLVWLGIGVGTVASVVVAWWMGSPIPVISPMRIAVASGLAFALSELLDTWVYSRLRERSESGGMLASNTLGAALDTALFLWVSGFGLTWPGFWGQLVVKGIVVSVPAVLVIRWVDRRVVRCAT